MDQELEQDEILRPGSYAAWAAEMPGEDERQILPVDPEIIQRALDRVKFLADGNGIDPETITLQKFAGEVLYFEACSRFTIKPTIAEKSVPGKEPGEACGSAADLRMKITTAIEKTTINPEIIGYLSDILEQREDKGFMIEGLTIKLDRLARKFIHHNSCTLCTSGKILCMACQGAGAQNCTRCRGHRTIVCPQCRGTKTSRQQDGSTGTCRKCNGHGESQCTACRATGKNKCTPCQGSGRTACQKCNATGIISEIAFVTFEASPDFAYDADSLPPDVPKLIDQLGRLLAVREHAEIQILKEKNQARIQREYETTERVKIRDGLMVPYDVYLPFGDIELQMGAATDGIVLAGKLFGLHPRLVHLPPFLEGPLGPGLDRLTQAANNLGSVRANLEEAMRLRAIGDAVIAAATLPPKKASQAIRGRWALGLRPDVAHKMVQMADKAVQNLTRKARVLGLVAGLVLTALFLTFYLVGPLRPLAAGQGLHHLALLALDLVLVVVAGYATILLSQLAGRRALSALLEKIAPDRAKKIIPRAGKTALYAYGGVVLVFTAILILAALTGHPLPEWVPFFKK